VVYPVATSCSLTKYISSFLHLNAYLVWQKIFQDFSPQLSIGYAGNLDVLVYAVLKQLLDPYESP
jgi:hypothetical protein